MNHEKCFGAKTTVHRDRAVSQLPDWTSSNIADCDWFNWFIGLPNRIDKELIKKNPCLGTGGKGIEKK